MVGTCKGNCILYIKNCKKKQQRDSTYRSISYRHYSVKIREIGRPAGSADIQHH